MNFTTGIHFLPESRASKIRKRWIDSAQVKSLSQVMWNGVSTQPQLQLVGWS